MGCIIKDVSEEKKRLETIQKAAEVILAGGIVAYPTETFYGLGVNAFDEEAVKKVFELKGRASHKPLLVLVGDEKQLLEIIEKPSPHAKKLMRRFWPGPLTLIFKASPKLPDILLGNTGKIGIRISSHDVARNLPLRAGVPVTSTSANPSGKPVLKNASDIREEWGEKIDLILDGGELKKSRGSTIIDVSENFSLIREGDISCRDIEGLMP